MQNGTGGRGRKHALSVLTAAILAVMLFASAGSGSHGGTTFTAPDDSAAYGSIAQAGYDSEISLFAGSAGITAIAAGNGFSLALMGDGTVRAWGNNQYGQLGDGTMLSSNISVQVVGENGIGYLTGVKAVSAGEGHSLALKSDGTVWAWGLNYNNQLGGGIGEMCKSTPVQVLGTSGAKYLNDVKAVSAGYDFSLALKSDGTVWAWGSNSHGQLGDGTHKERRAPIQVLDENGTDHLKYVAAISAGYDFSLALKSDGTVCAWGSNDHGQLGDGTSGAGTDKSIPVFVSNEDGTDLLRDIAAIGSGSFHSLALTNDGYVWSWGRNYFGQLGDGNGATGVISSMPVMVSDEYGTGHLGSVKAISAGNDHSVAVKTDGTVWTWGRDNYGQLGIGASGTYKNMPVQVSGENGIGVLTNVKVVAAGYCNIIALKSGTVWSWGLNSSGQLGDGTHTNRSSPVHAHTFAWAYSGTEHWHECPCGERTVGAGHVFGEEWKIGETKHWHACECGAKADKEEHVFGEWEHDENGHWRECGCGARADEGEHVFGEWEHNEDEHWRECGCGAKADKEEHVFGEWEHDANGHWHACECGARADEGEHVFEPSAVAGTDECLCGAVCESSGGSIDDNTDDGDGAGDGSDGGYDCGIDHSRSKDHGIGKIAALAGIIIMILLLLIVLYLILRKKEEDP